MVNVQIVRASEENIKELLHELKELGQEDQYRFGVASEEVLLSVYKRSLFVDAAFLDGKLVGVWGVLGYYLGSEGRPWSLLTPAIEKYPFYVTSFYRKALNKMLQLFPVLVDMVDIEHTKTLRMLKIMGFTFGEPMDYLGGSFIRAERRE